MSNEEVPVLMHVYEMHKVQLEWHILRHEASLHAITEEASSSALIERSHDCCMGQV